MIKLRGGPWDGVIIDAPCHVQELHFTTEDENCKELAQHIYQVYESSDDETLLDYDDDY